MLYPFQQHINSHTELDRVHKRRLTDFYHIQSSKSISPSKALKHLQTKPNDLKPTRQSYIPVMNSSETNQIIPKVNLVRLELNKESSDNLKHKHTVSEEISTKIGPFTSRSRHSLDFQFFQSSKNLKNEKNVPEKLTSKDLKDPKIQEKVSDKINLDFVQHNDVKNRKFSDVVVLKEWKATNDKNDRNLIEKYQQNDKKIAKNSTENNSQTFAKPGSQVLKYLAHRLTSFEKAELLDYPAVYFTGNILKRSEIPDLSFKTDDDRGNLILIPGDHVAYQFEVVEKLGHGSFGQVFKVLDHKSCTLKALKVISSGSKFQDQAFVEVKILRFLKKLDKDDTYSIVHIDDYFSFRQHFCITFELLSFSLYDFLKKNSFRGLSNSLIRRFASQVLHSLLLLSNHKIIHCDLKPENILLKTQNRSVIKVIDFGSSCFEKEKVFDYVQSRFYRAPEIVLGVEYSCAIDVWSFGCILAELFIGKPILPAANEADLLMRIVEIIGNPPEELLRRARRTNEFWVGRIWRAKEQVKFRRPLGRSIEKMLLGADELFVDFVKSCLKWDPSERISPKLALNHPWLK